MEVDRRLFLATLGVGALELMSPEDKAEALEHYMEEKLDAEIAARDGAEPARPLPWQSFSRKTRGHRAAPVVYLCRGPVSLLRCLTNRLW